MPKRAEGTGDPKRSPLSLRTTKEVRDKLEEAARSSGLSLAQEVERRIAESFRIEAAFGSGVRLDILQSIALTLKHVERLTGRSNYDTHADFIEVKKAVNGTLDQFMAILPDQPRGAALADAIKGTGRVGQVVADVQIMAMERELGSDKPREREATPQQRESFEIYVRELIRTDPEFAEFIRQRGGQKGSDQGGQTDE